MLHPRYADAASKLADAPVGQRAKQLVIWQSGAAAGHRYKWGEHAREPERCQYAGPTKAGIGQQRRVVAAGSKAMRRADSAVNLHVDRGGGRAVDRGRAPWPGGGGSC